MTLSSTTRTEMEQLLAPLYPGREAEVADSIAELADHYADLPVRSAPGLWNEQDAVLITYGDQVRREGQSPLSAQQEFLIDAGLDRALSTVHFLPFCPYSSDDGFSVIDYRQIDPNLGDWDDVENYREQFDLMFDLVLNHCSQHSQWFQDYLAGTSPYDGYFIEADPADDLSGVTRPRSLPLLTKFETSRGDKHIWTTFSDDQVDLNFANPAVLREMLDVLLFYIQRGARIIRLDAIAYLWKTIGASCIHLPQTHAVVKLMRTLVDELAPGTILLTETNVPHQENVSYFGDGDEAQMVYQFSLSPLLLDAFLTGDAGTLMRWLTDLEPPRPGTTYFNFTASHDGIGVRPLEGIVPPERVQSLVEAVEQRGGRVSTKRNPDGSDSPYELNITYFSALGEPDGLDPELHARKFLASQAIMLSLQGIPGIYFHSIVGTANDQAGVEQTGRARSINRRKFDRQELDDILANENSAQRQVFDGYRRMLLMRIAQPAFHPDASQQVVDVGHSAVVAYVRRSGDPEQTVLVLANVSGETCQVDLSSLDFQPTTDLLNAEAEFAGGGPVTLAPFQACWLTAH